MTKIVYFDTNVWDHIYKEKGVTRKDLEPLWSAAHKGTVSILLSPINLEEVLLGLKSSPDVALPELWLILKEADWQRVIKAPDLLLREGIRAYATGEALPEPFETDPVIQANLKVLQDPTQRDLDDLAPTLEEALQQREEFRARMRAARESWKANVLPKFKELQGERPSFNRYWEVSAESFAENLVRDPGERRACRKRGLKGLLEIRSIRLAVGSNLSLIYSQTFEGFSPDRGDSRDIHHAVSAAAADAFVTHDKRLSELLVRVPISGFHVMDLRRLLAEVR